MKYLIQRDFITYDCEILIGKFWPSLININIHVKYINFQLFGNKTKFVGGKNIDLPTNIFHKINHQNFERRNRIVNIK